MTQYKKILYSLIFVIAFSPIYSQNNSFNSFSEDETVLYTMNKQVGQFVNRFNMEEDQYGKRLPANDKSYRNNKLREDMLPIMFDTYNPRTSGKLKKSVVLKEIDPKKMLAVRIFGYTFLFIGISLILLIIYSMLFVYM